MNALCRYKYTSYTKNDEIFLRILKIHFISFFFRIFIILNIRIINLRSWVDLVVIEVPSLRKTRIDYEWRHTCSCHDADDVIVVTWLRRGHLSVGMTLLVKWRHLYVTNTVVCFATPLIIQVFTSTDLYTPYQQKTAPFIFHITLSKINRF